MEILLTLQRLYDGCAAAYRAGDARACAAYFVTTGELYSPYAPPARGRDAIEALHRDWTADGGGDKRLAVLEAGRSGQLAWCLARFSEGLETGDGTSLNIFERQEDGTWLIRISSLNSMFEDTRAAS